MCNDSRMSLLSKHSNLFKLLHNYLRVGVWMCCAATHGTTLQHTIIRCNTLQHTATLQRNATRRCVDVLCSSVQTFRSSSAYFWCMCVCVCGCKVSLESSRDTLLSNGLQCKSCPSYLRECVDVKCPSHLRETPSYPTVFNSSHVRNVPPIFGSVWVSSVPPIFERHPLIQRSSV